MERGPNGQNGQKNVRDYTGYTIDIVLFSEEAPDDLATRIPLGLGDGPGPADEDEAWEMAFEQAHDRYVRACIAALEQAFPGAEVSATGAGVMGIPIVPAAIHKNGVEVRDGTPEFKEMSIRIMTIMDRIAIETGDWKPSGHTPEQLEGLFD